MDKDASYYHFANLGLVLIGMASVQSLISPLLFFFIVIGTIAGFLTSWFTYNKRLQYVDLFIGMLSLATCVIIIGRLLTIAITFENLLKTFSIALIWLTLFQSFGLNTGKSYAIMQFISVCLLISSVGMALERDVFYIMLLSFFLLIFIFTMRLNLLCEKKRKGSVIIGDTEEIMGLWQQIKIGAVMFSLILVLSSFLYPFVPRFENLSLQWIPSSLLGIPEKVPLLKIFKNAPKTIQENKKIKKEQLIDDGTLKKREASGSSLDEDKIKKKRKSEIDKEKVKRIPARKLKRDIDIFKVKSITIGSSSNRTQVGRSIKLKAELKMNDGSTIPATALVDWKVTGSTQARIDEKGNLTPKEAVPIKVSATYMGAFSNEITIQVTTPPEPETKKERIWRWIFILIWLLILLLLAFLLWMFSRSRKLYKLALINPREFIKRVYLTLCAAFKFYGVPRFDYVAFREFFGHVKSILSPRPAAMATLTERVLEARFSAHEITMRHSGEAVYLFREIKDVLFQREGRREVIKKIMFFITVLDVLLLPKDLKQTPDYKQGTIPDNQK